ncbi:sensor histidine kinase [Eleftheria terrae]|uniref:sensor histidine kinase n=1 Tax=Eleftheria terrae TaxID=1597781 RepID=UPI00263BADEA|nr:ATP-binding protein [Eleftheria terrae]WKB56094.1 histidine kinase [Eleftheria terrae]
MHAREHPPGFLGHEAAPALQRRVVRRNRRLLSPLCVSLVYAAVSAAWIFVIDGALPVRWEGYTAGHWHTAESIGFLCITTLLLYAVLRSLQGRLDAMSREAAASAAAVRRSAQELERLLTLLPEAVLITHGQQIVYANQVAQDLLAPGAGERLRGSPLLERFAPECHAQVEARMAAVLSGGPRDLRFLRRTMLRLDGSRFEAQVGISAVHLDDRPAVLQILRNVDDALLAQREAEQARAELAALSSSLIEVQERERRSIARELHDEIGQSLSAIRVQFAKLQRRLDSPELLALIGSAATMTESTLGRVRSLSLLLHPPQLETLGLEAALRWHINELRQVHDVKIRFSAPRLEQPVHPDLAIAAYRIVQEALSNALRHAQASRIEVHLRCDAQALTVSIEDDGVGFCRPRDTTRPTLGLIGMVERARLLGGTLCVDSRPGTGTRIAATLPWKTP